MFEQYSKITWLDLLQFGSGVLMTLKVTLISIVLGVLLGTVLGLIRCSKNKVVSALPLLFIEPLRNSPLVTQLFLIYYGIPMITKWMPSATICAIATLSLNTAAFFAVLFNSSIKAIPIRHWDAGYALGHSKKDVFLLFIVPQAWRLLIPQAVTLFIGQLQCSSLVSLIGLLDLTKIGQTISLRTMMPFASFGIVALFYFAVSFPLSKLARSLEQKNSIEY